MRSQRSETGVRRNEREETGCLRSFAQVFSRSAISCDLSTIHKETACSLVRKRMGKNLQGIPRNPAQTPAIDDFAWGSSYIVNHVETTHAL